MIAANRVRAWLRAPSGSYDKGKIGEWLNACGIRPWRMTGGEVDALLIEWEQKS